MNKKVTIMLDMDGVCCDWITAALIAVNRKDLIHNWKAGITNLKEMTGLEDKDIWKKIDALGSDWWKNLREYDWFWDLYSGLSDIGEVMFCTSPGWDSNSFKGKIEWLQDKFGRDFRNYIFTNKKYYVANENTILVDDNDKQCKEFIEHGGKAIVFPQLWNSMHPFESEIKKDPKYKEKKLEYVLNKVKELQC